MMLDYKSIELDGITVFEKLAFVNSGRNTKELHNEACFMFLVKGGFDVRTPINSIRLSEGDGFLTQCGDYFFEDMNIDESKAEPIEAIGIYFHPDIIKQLFQYQPVTWDKNLTHKVDVDLLMEHYKLGVMHYIDNPHLFDREMQLLKIKELVLLLAQSSEAPSLHHFLSALFSPHEFNFRQIIEQNIISSVSLSDLAYLCGLSLASFKRRFTEMYNDSPAAYIKKRKLEHATQLLKTSRLNINEIAFDCGFESVGSFNRLFKTQYQQTPTQYRLSQND